MLKTIKDPTMSLTDRLRKIEADITELKRQQQDIVQALTDLSNALDEGEEEAEPPELTLDGEQAGGERDTSQGLDG